MKTSPASVARLHRLSLVAAALGTLTLAACGGGSSDSTTTTVPNSFPAATVVIGQTNFSNIGTNAGSGTPSAGSLAQPVGAAGSNGAILYVPDLNNNRVLGFSALPTANNPQANFVLGQAGFTTSAAGTSSSSFKLPGRAWVSSTGQLVVADTNNNRVLIWNTLPAGNIPADVVVGQPDFTSNSGNQALGAPTASTLYGPTAAVIASGKLIVADTVNQRVLIWNTVPTTVPAPAADVVIGQPSATTNVPNNDCSVSDPDCPNTPVASQNNLNTPYDVWADDSGRLLVADSVNNRVMYWSQIPTSTFQQATYVMGQSSFTRQSSSISVSGFNNPLGVTSDGSRIYVADANNNRVMVFSGFPTSNGGSATTVIGQNSFSHNAPNDDNQTNSTTASNSNVVSARTLNHPTAATIVGGTKLFVTDSSNNRVLVFQQ